MIKEGKLDYKITHWLFVFLFLIFVLSHANALEIPVLNSLKFPSFKYGKLKRDKDVNHTFVTFKILPDHRYYTSGQADIPYAIIGIRNSFKLRPGVWREVNPTTPLLRSWVSQMDNIYGYPPYGSAILDNNGKSIGVWYSSKQWTTVIIEENNEIAVLAPELPGFRGSQ